MRPAGENAGDPAASWETREGSRGHGARQSGHNTGLIHHMGITLLAGTATEKSYTRSRPATESINIPLPPTGARGACLRRDRPNGQELLT